MKILIAEDDMTSALLLQRALIKAGYQVCVAHDGKEALAALGREAFDALLTDWMMPEMDGIDLIRRVRRGEGQKRDAPPALMVLTSLGSEEARQHALSAGADDYIAKPYDPGHLVSRLADLLCRRDQPLPKRSVIVPMGGGAIPPPPFVGVAVAASTGGPQAVIEVFRGLSQAPSSISRASFFIVIHGPPWMLETFAHRLQQETRLKVNLAAEGTVAAPGEAYLAPGDRHLAILSDLRLHLTDEPPENFVRPAADLLFRSVAKVFGRSSLAVVMTGLGRDGARGAEQIVGAGGVVLVQDPTTAVASSMPQAVISLGLAREIVPLSGMSAAIQRNVDALGTALQQPGVPRFSGQPGSLR